jgi:cysteine desulfurase
MKNARIYLDNSATTKIAPEVLEAMLPFLTEEFGNASSLHSFGQQAKAAVDSARRQVAALLTAEPNEIIFVSGGTEANNLAIRGIMQAYAGKGNHIITSQFEHPAVANTCAAMEKSGWRVSYLPVYQNGRVRLEDLRAAITDQTLLVSIMHANNEVGTLQPIAEIGQLIKQLRLQHKYLFFHTDAVQSVGKVVVNARELGVDLLSLSGHKIHAPKGVGALYLRKGIRLSPQLTGGHHERDRRAGTENVPGIVALGKAAELARLHLESIGVETKILRDYLETSIEKCIPYIQFNGERENRVPNITNISFRYLEGEGLLIALDLKGIAVSTGSACSSGSTEPSPILAAMGLSKELSRGSLRFSLSRYNNRAEIDYLLQVLPAAVEHLRRISPLYQREVVTNEGC